MARSVFLAVAACGAAISGNAISTEPVCQPAWVPTFSGGNGVNNAVYMLRVLDDGNGPALYVGGIFTNAGGDLVKRLAKWDGLVGNGDWTGFGTGFSGEIRDVAFFDDGSGTGPTLYAGGVFTNAGSNPINHIARWNGSTWSALGSGLPFNISKNICSVSALEIFDDGSGPALYVGGYFDGAGGNPIAAGVAKWDGTQWHALGGGIYGSVNALAVFDDGTGPALYAAGQFWPPNAAGYYIVKWNGTNWIPLGSGLNDHVYSLAVFDDGGGPALYVGGRFTMAGGIPANRIAKWMASPTGGSWAVVGSGIDVGCDQYSCVGNCGGQAPTGCFCDEACCGFGDCCADKYVACGGCDPKWSPYSLCAVNTLTVFNDGSGAGPMLYAAGFFPSAGTSNSPHVTRWNGIEWQALPSGLGSDKFSDTVYALVGYEGNGQTPALFVGGEFTSSPAGDSYLAHWQGCRKCSPADVNCDGAINVADLLAVINAWGACPAPPTLCEADINDDGAVNVLDLLMVINNWG